MRVDQKAGQILGARRRSFPGKNRAEFWNGKRRLRNGSSGKNQSFENGLVNLTPAEQGSILWEGTGEKRTLTYQNCIAKFAASERPEANKIGKRPRIIFIAGRFPKRRCHAGFARVSASLGCFLADQCGLNSDRIHDLRPIGGDHGGREYRGRNVPLKKNVDDALRVGTISAIVFQRAHNEIHMEKAATSGGIASSVVDDDCRPPIDRNIRFTFFYTSGSTGKPKESCTDAVIWSNLFDHEIRVRYSRRRYLLVYRGLSAGTGHSYVVYGRPTARPRHV